MSQLRTRWNDATNNRKLRALARQVAAHAPLEPDGPPVAFFRASTGLLRLSQNTAFALLSAWSLRLSGTPAVHFACRAGMSRCIQGLDRRDFQIPPPCPACVAQSERTYRGAPVHWFDYQASAELNAALDRLSLEDLEKFTFGEIPLGSLVLPSLRWILRRHNLAEDRETRFLAREYLLSAYRVAGEFDRFLDETGPRVVVVFNGSFFPEASARWAALRRGLRVITHEVGMRPYSAFFTAGEATAYPIEIPPDFELSAAQNARLDAYLEQRFQGNFTMAGIRFWPEMHGLDPAFVDRASRFKQIVPVFTNVIFDTSQVHANTIFANMFAWLETVADLARSHPETLFVIRAHPDELRANKATQESVQDWVQANQVTALSNVVFVAPEEYLSSYELILRAKFTMVYNSSIGLEASTLGSPVLCGGKARYTQYPTVFLPTSADEYRRQAEAFLASTAIEVPEAFRRNARRFLYYQLYKASLPFDSFLDAHTRPGFVQLGDFGWQDLLPERSPTLNTIVRGIQKGAPFILENGEQP